MEFITAIAAGRRTRKRLDAAEGYLSLGMYSHALRELREIPDIGPERFEYHALKAEAFRGLHDWENALAAFQCCAQEKPTDLGVLMGMAWCYKRTEQLSRAIAAMHDAYAAHPDIPVVLYNLSCYYALGNQKSQALNWLARALRMAPQFRSLIDKETDFDLLRDSPEFQKLLKLTA